MNIMVSWAAIFTMAIAGLAEGDDGGKAEAFRSLMACRAIQDASERLQCYDAQAAIVVSAEKSGKLIVADEAQIKQARRDLFGFGSVRLPFLSGTDANAVTQIEAVVSGVRQIAVGRWEFTLDNGTRWRQADDEQIFPKPGQSIVIKAGALGSYWLKIKSKATRVIRER